MKQILVVFLAILGSASTIRADLIVSRGTFGVDRYTNSGVFLGNVIAPGAGGLSDAQGVAITPSGDYLVGDFVNDNILRFAANGAFVGVFASGPAIATPFDVVTGPGGHVFVANAGGLDTLARLDPVTGAVIDASFITDDPAHPTGGPQYLEFGPSLALTDIAGRLFRFDPVTGAHVSTVLLDNPEGVAFAANGDLYVAQRISDNVLRFPFGGGPAQEVIATGAFGGAPADLEFGPDGLLYLSADQIYRFDVSGANGVLVDSFGTGGEFLVFTPVPEPTATAASLIAGFALAVLRRRSRSARG
jgi:streptogramin lyase